MFPKREKKKKKKYVPLALTSADTSSIHTRESSGLHNAHGLGFDCPAQTRNKPNNHHYCFLTLFVHVITLHMNIILCFLHSAYEYVSVPRQMEIILNFDYVPTKQAPCQNCFILTCCYSLTPKKTILNVLSSRLTVGRNRMLVCCQWIQFKRALKMRAGNCSSFKQSLPEKWNKCCRSIYLLNLRFISG